MSPLPVADRWFERRAFGDGVTLLWEPHVHPLLRCNIWHVQGRDRDLLIDTGLGVASLATAARDLFEKPLTVALTHCHMDHAGGACEFADCCVHAAEAQALADGSNHLPLDMAAYGAEDLAWFASIGYDISGGLLTAVPHKGFDPASHRMAGATVGRLIGEGDVVDLGDRRFQVLHLPGHSPGSIGLYESASQTLFSGDAIYDGPLLDQIPRSDIAAYRVTMERLLALAPRTIHAGHEHSFGRDRLAELAGAYLRARGGR